MTAPDYAALVEKARTTYAGNTFVNKLADAIERLTQPTEAEVFSADEFHDRKTEVVKLEDHKAIVARLVAERDAAADSALRHAIKYESMAQAITDAENQPSQYGTVRFTEYRALQEQVKALREAIGPFAEYDETYPPGTVPTNWAAKALAITAAAACQCDLRTKLVGDGCAACNPERAADLSEDKP